ncbi:hypothetical protein IE4872_PD01337 (plasmid) [Rhizobium gallicum]|uniref:Uncharacterized protein n=1 Tax=Rhizobium gallicum TaxID=56730 RepID=A0A1L5NVF2_9HYPH|nr:hypothetical protein IE4872_PD01337 [Rhizobium gallicum]
MKSLKLPPDCSAAASSNSVLSGTSAHSLDQVLREARMIDGVANSETSLLLSSV